jgi:hypothetical protein
MAIDNESKKTEAAPEDDGFMLLEKAKAGEILTVRDDQAEYSLLFDAARLCRSNGGRFRLVDSNAFESSKMEWLAQAGADIYTSEDVGRPAADLQGIALAGRKGKAVVASLILGKAEDPMEEVGTTELEPTHSLAGPIFCGLRIHIRSGEGSDVPSFSRLISLASNHQSSGSNMVAYHRGPLCGDLVNLGENGAWIHMTEESLQELDNTILLRDVVKASQKAGANGIFHIGNAVDVALFRDLQSMGAVLTFQTPHFDYRSPYREYEDWAKDLSLDYRAFYLYPAFFP